MPFYVTMIIYLLILIIPCYASIRLHITYSSIKKKKNKKGLTGYDVAKKILDNNGLQSIYIVETNGTITDNYDSNRRVLRLSKEVYNGDSIASIAIAAHEAGHAVQHAEEYSWFMRRHKIYPTVAIGEKVSYIVLIIGLVLGSVNFIYAAVILMVFGLAFEIVTLPCELDATKRGLKLLQDYDLIESSDVPQARKMLKAAAYTYIAAIASTLLEMVYYISRFSRRD